MALQSLEYESAGGRGLFLAYREESGSLFGYCRLRLDEVAATVRELKVVGRAIPLGKAHTPGKRRLQHQGFGGRLMAEAEGLATDSGARQLRVTSGVGVRPYYRKLGYLLQSGYMVKELV